MTAAGPAELILVRHAQSAGNVARDVALAAHATTIGIDVRDCDVPLSPLGERQATALGRWAARELERPDVVYASPYVRARETAALALDAARWPDVPVIVDERLREKDLGLLDRLTRAGIEQRYPAEVAQRARLGKFYYRPPGGESWADVILRLRSIYGEILAAGAGARVTVVAHQVTVLCSRYLLEGMTEGDILAIDAEAEVANCSVTLYRHDPATGALRLRAYNAVAPLEESGEPVTRSADVPL